LSDSGGVAFLSPASFANVPAGADFNLSVTSLAGPNAELQIFYRLGGSQGVFTGPIVMTGNEGTYTGTIPQASVSIRGLEVYLRGIQNGVVSTLGSASGPIQVQTVINNLNSPTPPNAIFQMIGFPFEVNPANVTAVFEDDLGAPDPTQWKLGRWDGTVYQEYRDVEDIASGHGYWLAVRHNRRYGASGLSAKPTLELKDGKRYAHILLKPGWNQISTPFGFDIRWDSRVEDVPDDITNELFNYLGGPVMYNTVPVLEPFRGYWVENTSSPAEDRSLWLPYEENTKKSTVGVPPIAKAANADDWRLSLELLAGGVKDDLLTLGVRDRATDGYDAQDYGQPPYPEGRFLALSSVMAAVGGDQERQLAGDFRQPGAEGWRFTVWARGDVGSVVQLRQGSRSRLPQTFAVALYDPATGLKYDVSDINGLVLPNALTASGTMYEVDRKSVV